MSLPTDVRWWSTKRMNALINIRQWEKCSSYRIQLKISKRKPMARRLEKKSRSIGRWMLNESHAVKRINRVPVPGIRFIRRRCAIHASRLSIAAHPVHSHVLHTFAWVIAVRQRNCQPIEQYANRMETHTHTARAAARTTRMHKHMSPEPGEREREKHHTGFFSLPQPKIPSLNMRS